MANVGDSLRRLSSLQHRTYNLLVDYQAIKLRITGHGLQVAGVAGEALGAVRRQQEADERRQTAEAEQDASAAVQDARDLPRVGRQAGQVELAAVHTA